MKKTAIFIKIAPRRLILYLKIDHCLVFKEEIGGTKKFAPDLVGAPGRGTWSEHLVGTPPTNMSPPAPAGDPPGYPPHRPGTWSHTLTHTTHTHTPKDIIRTQKINLLGKTLQVQLFFILSSIITGRSWADHGATIGDHAKHARSQKSWPLRGSRKYQIFSVFGSEQHVFQNIACFVPIIMKNKSDVRFEIELFDVEPDDTMW